MYSVCPPPTSLGGEFVFLFVACFFGNKTNRAAVNETHTITKGITKESNEEKKRERAKRENTRVQTRSPQKGDQRPPNFFSSTTYNKRDDPRNWEPDQVERESEREKEEVTSRHIL